MKKTKYLLTTSADKHVIIAEVPHNHAHNDREYVISSAMVKVNVESGLFTDVSDELDYQGKIWMLTEDL